jgi:sec-independent protein translocase protein TatC
MASTPTNTDRFDHLGLEMPFGDHLEDLRRRVVYGLLGIVPIFFVALFVFAKPLVIFLLQPGNDAQRNSGNTPQYEVNGPFEFFNAYVKVAMVLTIIVGLPWVLYQGWKFVAPGLYAHEKRFAYTLVPMSAVLAALGVVFMYTVMLPVVMAFFIEFSSAVTGDQSPLIERSADAPTSLAIESYPGNPANPSNGELWHNTYLNQLCIASVGKDGVTTIYATPLTLGTQLIRPDYRVADYIDTVFDFALAFAVAFQAPVAVLLLGWAGIINPGMMGKFRRHAIMVCTVLGAALTPADPFSIFLLAVPLYLLYEFGVVLLRWLPASRVAHGLRGEPPDPEASGP